MTFVLFVTWKGVKSCQAFQWTAVPRVSRWHERARGRHSGECNGSHIKQKSNALVGVKRPDSIA